MHTFKIGDTIKIIDARGADNGEVGDLGKILSIENQYSDALIEIILLTGKDKDLKVTRFAYRYKKANLDWDE